MIYIHVIHESCKTLYELYILQKLYNILKYLVLNLLNKVQTLTTPLII